MLKQYKPREEGGMGTEGGVTVALLGHFAHAQVQRTVWLREGGQVGATGGREGGGGRKGIAIV